MFGGGAFYPSKTFVVFALAASFVTPFAIIFARRSYSEDVATSFVFSPVYHNGCTDSSIADSQVVTMELLKLLFQAANNFNADTYIANNNVRTRVCLTAGSVPETPTSVLVGIALAYGMTGLMLLSSIYWIVNARYPQPPGGRREIVCCFDDLLQPTPLLTATISTQREGAVSSVQLGKAVEN